MPYGQDEHKRAGLLLVKDDGIYVMSNGSPRDVKGKGPHCHVVYAEGFNPRKGDVWDKCRAAVGGDDFVEFVPITLSLFHEIIKQSADLVVHIDDDTMTVSTMATVAKVPA